MNSSHLQSSRPYAPPHSFPCQYYTPEHHLECSLPCLVLEIMHAQQRTRPSTCNRQCMQRSFPDPPLQIPRLHLIVAIVKEGDTTGYTCPRDRQYRLGRGVEANQRTSRQDKRYNACNCCRGQRAVSRFRAVRWHVDECCVRVRESWWMGTKVRKHEMELCPVDLPPLTFCHACAKRD